MGTVIRVDSACGSRTNVADLSCSKVLGFKHQLSRTVRPRSNLPNGGLNGIARPNGGSESDSEMNQRVRVVVSNNRHNRSSNEAECTQSVENDTSKARRLTYPGVYGN